MATDKKVLAGSGIGEQKMIGYHFLAANKQLGHGNRKLIEVGKTITVNNANRSPPGLYACKQALEALRYARGPIACKVKLGGTIIHGDDKSVGTERTCLAMIDATDILQKFGRMCALDVVHLWDAPASAIRFLKTGDLTIQTDDWKIPSDPTQVTQNGYLAAYAAWGGVRTTWDALDPVWNAAWYAAQDAAEAIDLAAAEDAAEDAAWHAAFNTARKRQNRRLVQMLSRAWRRQG